MDREEGYFPPCCYRSGGEGRTAVDLRGSEGRYHRAGEEDESLGNTAGMCLFEPFYQRDVSWR